MAESFIDPGKEHVESYFHISSRNRGERLKHETTHRKERSVLKNCILRMLKIKARQCNNSQNEKEETQGDIASLL